MQWLKRLHRLEQGNVALYVDPFVPDWFVPSTKTDALLRAARDNSFRAALADYCDRYHEEPDQARRDLDRLKHLLAKT
ncbi:MAG: hypothetical protein DSY70_04665, partial [Desulfobulbus sp.]